jgi:transposase
MSDGPSFQPIPNDLAACQLLIADLSREVNSKNYLAESQSQMIGELDAKVKQLEEREKEYQLTIQELLERAFARRSERYLADPHQLQLDFPEVEGSAEAAEGLAEAVEEAGLVVQQHVRHKKKRKPGSEQLPAHLPRHEVIAETPEDLKHCPEHGERKVIGYDLTETLKMKRPELYVEVTKFPKYACEDEPACGIASPERPTGLVEGNKYDTSIAAEILTNKYGYHLPIYRQQDQFAGSGWTPSRSTLLNIATAAHFALRPLVEHIQQTVLADDILGTDDTRLTLLVPKVIPEPDPLDEKSQRIHQRLSEVAAQGKPSVSARMWAYRSVTVPLVFFDFTVSRGRAGPDLVLADYRGKLMADCYSVYQGIELRTDGQIERGACVAHARRKVFEARESYPREAAQLLAQFQQLYDIEDRAATMSVDERFALRQAEALPVWQAMGTWLQSAAAQDVVGKFGDALGYLRNHWEPLQLYPTDGRMPIDNNDVEQLMKQIALGRKNWLFVGSVAAGERTADFFTLVTSAVRNDLDVWAYFKDVLDRLLAGETDYESLRPDVWRAAHPEAVRHYRVEERRDKADRKQLRRATRRAQAAALRS